MVNEATQRMTIETTSKENYYSKQCVNYFKQHYGNEHAAADNLKQPSLPVVTQWVKIASD